MDPSKKLTTEDVLGIAKFARIDLTPQDTERLVVELNSIIESLQPIREIDLEGVEPTFHPIEGLVNVFREDEIKPPLPQSVALQNSSSVEEGAFLVPTILGGGDAS
jgi:aspartyl-tRNA(Asn)/glutamyl-tRNA(Gln) amidotransferase subunit C